MDSQKEVHVITSYEILGFLRDIGGFRGALDLVFSTVGVYFSSNMFKVALVNEVFYQKTDENKFTKVCISLIFTLFSPFLSIITFCSKKQKTNNQLLSEGMKRFKKSLEVTSLIHQLNSTGNLTKQLLCEDNTYELTKYSKFNVLEIRDINKIEVDDE